MNRSPLRFTYPYVSSINDLDFSSDGRFLAIGYSEGYVRIWDIEKGESLDVPDDVLENERMMRSLGRLGRTEVYCVKFSPDGKYVLAGGALYDFERKDASYNERTDVGIEVSEIRLWDVETGETIKYRSFRDNFVNSVAFSPDGKAYAVSYENDEESGINVIKIWDTETGDVIQSIESSNGEVQSLAFTPDGSKLAVSYFDSESGTSIVFWNLDDGSYSSMKTPYLYRDLDFSRDGLLFSANSYEGGSIAVWNSSTGEMLRDFTELDGVVSFASDMSPDGEFVVGIADRNMIVWNVSSGEVLTKFNMGLRIDRHRAVEFSPDMAYIVTGTAIPFDSIYSFTHEDFVEAYDAGLSYKMLLPLDRSGDPVYVWDFQDIKENNYMEGFLDAIGEMPFNLLLVMGFFVVVFSVGSVLFILLIGIPFK
jgi:WD40 repeat protein